jgi:hypothetical protein
MVSAADAIDAGYVDQVKKLFETAARHFDGGHPDQARTAIRKGLSIAEQTRSEMRSIAGELDARDVSSN